MKKICFILFFIVGCLGIFADTTTNNGVTRIREGRYTKIVYPDNYKPKKSRYAKVVNQVDIYLDYYVLDGKEQYAIAMKYMGVLLDFPGILPSGSSMKITTANGHDMSLNSILVQNETTKHLGEEGAVVCGYFLLSKQQLDEICLGVSSVSFDIVISDKITTFNDKATIKGNKFSKEINSFYKAIQKEKSKLNISENKSETENSNIVLSYHGFEYNPFLYGEFLKWSDLQHDEITWEAFLDNQDAINSQYNSMLLDVMMRNTRQSEFARSLAGSFNAVLDGVNAYAQARQQENALKAAVQKAKREQEEAEMKAIMQANTLANQQRMEAKEQQESNRRNAAAQNYYNSYEQARSNGNSSRSMQTSDLAQYNAARMSDATYGTAATNQALSQQRQYDAQQNQQARINEQRMLDQQLGTTENAITSSGARIQIKVKNGVVTAYSTSNSNYSGTGPEWNRVSSPVSRTTDNRYGYEANLVGVGKVFWGESRPVISNQLGGVAVNAVTINGETIQIRVENEVVIAYRKNGNSPWNGQAVSAKKTNVTYDGEQIASRFKYKADLPGIGTVYF